MTKSAERIERHERRGFRAAIEGSQPHGGRRRSLTVKPLWVCALLSALTLLAGCQESATAEPARATLTAPEQAPERAALVRQTHSVDHADHDHADEMKVLLHAAADSHLVLRGEMEPVPENTDADRIIVMDDAIPELSIDAGMRFIDAKVVSDGIVAVGFDRVLRHYTRDGVVELDFDVWTPLSVAADRVAYVSGGPPILTLKRADLRTGLTDVLTPEIRTAYSPALSPDGSELVFVANLRGEPQLMHADADGTLHEIAWSGRTPSSPVAPQWHDEFLVFTDEEGVAVLDMSEGQIVAEHVGASLIPDHRDGGIWMSVDGHRTRLELEEVVR